MNVGDLPQLTSNNLLNSSYCLSDLVLIGGSGGSVPLATNKALVGTYFDSASATQTQDKVKEKKLAKDTRRLVEVIIIDPDPLVPLEKSVIYQGGRKLTELDDQELFFELDIKKLLADHNEQRVKIVNKKVKERTEFLEPARVRDLKMVVVNVAVF